MVREVSRRLFAAAALLIACGMSLATTSEAQAAGSTANIGGASVPIGKPPPSPTSVTISGDGILDPLTVRADSQPEMFSALLDQVDWLVGRGQTHAPKTAALGPKYTLVVSVRDVAKHTYDLYPLAAGGPRAFRPAKQPDQQETTDAWFFGRLSMPETLRAAGIPLAEKVDFFSGGIGGGRAMAVDASKPGEDLDRALADLRQVLLLNAAVLLTVTLGLAGMSLLVRSPR